MKLPNSAQAYIEAQKLTDYLLSEDHPEGQAKARYFRSIGFNEKNIDLFKQRLIDLAQSEPVTVSYTTPHGEKYVIEGQLIAPNGHAAAIRTVWIVDMGASRPRFVTAYPLGG